MILYGHGRRLLIETLNQWRDFTGEALPGSEDIPFTRPLIDQLPPGVLRKNVASYMEQFGNRTDIRPNPEELGPPSE